MMIFVNSVRVEDAVALAVGIRKLTVQFISISIDLVILLCFPGQSPVQECNDLTPGTALVRAESGCSSPLRDVLLHSPEDCVVVVICGEYIIEGIGRRTGLGTAL